MENDDFISRYLEKNIKYWKQKYSIVNNFMWYPFISKVGSYTDIALSIRLLLCLSKKMLTGYTPCCN